MNIQRLKFAWARGARIQLWASGHGPWVDYERGQDRVFEAQVSLRIHPDDAHLEYGHLSRALRDNTLSGKVEAQDTYDAASMLIRYYLPYSFLISNEKDAVLLRMFRLFFAEMLADEGL